VKSIGWAYVLWFALGWHYAYLKEWCLQVLYWLTLGGLLVWALVDLFRIPRMVRNYNSDIAEYLKKSKGDIWLNVS